MGTKSKKTVVGYWYLATLHMALGLAADEIYKIIVGGKTAWTGSIKQNGNVTINNPNLFGGEKAEGGISGNLSVMFGGDDQPQNSLLVRLLGNTIPAFRGFVSMVFDGYLCAINPYPKTWEFCYRRILAGWPDNNPWYPEKATIILADGKIHSMNPAHILYESYISDTWGAGVARARMDDAAFKAAADTLYNEAFGICIEWKITDELSKFRDTICEHIGARLDTSPVTGLITITLIRDDYNLNDLPVFDEDNGLLEITFDSANNTEVPSQVILKYMDAVTFQECSVMANNPAVAQAQGGRSSETVEFLGIPTGELATRVAYRELKAKTSSLKRCNIKLDSRAAAIVNGQPFRVRTLRRENNIDYIIRAEKITESFITDGSIKMACLQDVFGLPKIAYNPTPPNHGEEQPLPPEAVTDRLLMEAPYRELAALLDPANLQLVDDTTAFYFVVAAAPNQYCRSYNLLSRVRGASAFNTADDLGVWCPTAQLATDISYLDSRITIEQTNLLEAVEIGTAAIIDNEIVRIDGIDLLTNQLIIGRGCIDTVPTLHSKGTTIWFYDSFETTDGIEYNPNVIIESKLLSNTSTDQLEASQAPTETITLQGRQAKPYPPANVKVNGLAYPTIVDDYLTVSWVERNRLLQADQLIDTTVGNIAAEDDTTYNISFITNGEIAHRVTGLRDKSYTWADETGMVRDYILMHFEDNLIDEVGNTWTATGTPEYADGIVGNKAIRFNSGTLTNLQSNNITGLDFGTNIDFTIEFWCRPLAFDADYGAIIASNQSSHNSLSKLIMMYGDRIEAKGKMGMGGYGTTSIISTTSLTVNQWAHVAFTREGNLCRVFINGILENSQVITVPFNFAAGGTLLGRNKWNGDHGLFKGDIDEFRASKGCLYTEDFTPTTIPYELASLDALNKRVTIEIEAERDAIKSWQKHSFVINRSKE